MVEHIDPGVLTNKDAYARAFRSADYFPHVLIKNFFSESVCHQLAATFPSYDAKEAVNELGQVGLKAWREKVRDLGEIYARVDDTIRSPEFLELMSDITGIPNLLYDAQYIGGGTHENLHGSELDIHVDFNYHPSTGWHRRLNLIVFLNEEWEADWGGQFEVHDNPWDPENDEYKSFPPFFNHAVIFETNERSWHGFDKVVLPEEKRHLSRKSFAIYLYTKDRPADEIAPSHATVYVPRPLPEQLTPGYTLQKEDVEHLGTLLRKRDDQIRFLYEREKELNEVADKAVELMRRNEKLEGMLENLLHPLTRGNIEFVGAPEGIYKDRWTSGTVEGRIKASQPISQLLISAYAPDFFAAERRLKIEVGDKTFEKVIGHGVTEIVLDIELAQDEEARFRLFCEETVKPNAQGISADDRQLAYQLTAILGR